jgi:hypothetical protein
MTWVDHDADAIPFGEGVEFPPPLTDTEQAALEQAKVSFRQVSPGGLGGKKKLAFGPLSSMLENVPQEPAWIWDGYLAPGALTLLAGRPKVGKTMFGFGLFASLVAGEPFCERETRRSGVLLLSEEREGTLAEKARDWSLNGHVHLLMRHQANEHEWRAVVAEASDYCELQNLGVLIVDTWDKWTGLKGDAENNAGAVLEALNPLILAAGRGLAVLIMAHQRKSVGEFGEAVRGSNALVGGVDVVTELERPRASALAGEGVRVLRAVSRYAATPEELVVALTEQGYESRGDSLAVQAESERGQVLAALETLGEATYEQLREETGLPRSTVQLRLEQLGESVLSRGKGVRGDPRKFLPNSQTPSGGNENESEELPF